MLKFFSRKDSKSQRPSKKKPGGTQIVQSSKADPLVTRETLSTAERELYQFEAPTQELGLSDLIKNHNEGDRFQYVALTGKDTETYEARLRRMVTFRPRMSKSMIPLNDLPHIKLIEESESLSLVSVLPKKGDDYIRVHSVSGYFSPTVSVMSNFSKVHVCLMDSRFSPPAEIQSVTVNSNIDAKVELSMDFCVPRSDADKINLMVSLEQSTISYGHQWGALQVQLALEESSFPNQSHMKNVVGILAPTASALEDFTVNPNTLDITMTEGDRKRLRGLYQSGDIADEDEPIKVKKAATKYAKSSVRGLVKGNTVEGSEVVKPGFEFMQGFRKPQVSADEISEEPSEEGFDDDDDIDHGKAIQSKDAWEKEQEEMRAKFASIHKSEIMSDTTEEIERPEFPPRPRPIKSAMRNFPGSTADSGFSSGTQDLPSKKSGVKFGTLDV
jgi:hypothetical protein